MQSFIFTVTMILSAITNSDSTEILTETEKKQE